MKHIVITEFMAETALKGFGRGFSVHYDPELVRDRETLLSAVKTAHGLIVRNQTQVDSELLEAAPDLQAIGRLGVGLDNIDMSLCKARKIDVYPATGANANAVAEYVLTTAMMLRRNAYYANNAMIGGQWPRHMLSSGRELAGATIGFIGFGSIAQVVAFKAQALGMKTIACDPFLAPDDKGWSHTRRAKKTEVFEQADVVSLHVPLTEGTKNLVNGATLELMKPDAVLISTARGGVVDETALIVKLTECPYFGAALDVFETEPLTQEKAAFFKDCSNLILTPHIAGVSVEANERVSETTVRNIKKALKYKWF